MPHADLAPNDNVDFIQLKTLIFLLRETVLYSIVFHDKVPIS